MRRELGEGVKKRNMNERAPAPCGVETSTCRTGVCSEDKFRFSQSCGT
jgi:hypothetical protein